MAVTKITTPYKKRVAELQKQYPDAEIVYSPPTARGETSGGLKTYTTPSGGVVTEVHPSVREMAAPPTEPKIVEQQKEIPTISKQQVQATQQLAAKQRAEEAWTKRIGRAGAESLARSGKWIQSKVPAKTEKSTAVGTLTTIDEDTGEVISKTPVLYPVEKEVGLSRIRGTEGKFEFQKEFGKRAVRSAAGLLEIPKRVLKWSPETAQEQGKWLVKHKKVAVVGAGTAAYTAAKERPYETAADILGTYGAAKLVGIATAPKVTRTVDLARVEGVKVGKDIAGKSVRTGVYEAGKHKYLARTAGEYKGVATKARTVTTGKGGVAIQRIIRGKPSKKIYSYKYTSKDVSEPFLKKGDYPYYRQFSLADMTRGREKISVEGMKVSRRTSLEKRFLEDKDISRMKFEEVGGVASKKGVGVGIGKVDARVTEYKIPGQVGKFFKGKTGKKMKPLYDTPQPIPAANIDKAIKKGISSIESSKYTKEAAVTTAAPKIFADTYRDGKATPTEYEYTYTRPKIAEDLAQRSDVGARPAIVPKEFVGQKEMTKARDIVKFGSGVRADMGVAQKTAPVVKTTTALKPLQLEAQKPRAKIPEVEIPRTPTTTVPFIPRTTTRIGFLGSTKKARGLLTKRVAGFIPMVRKRGKWFRIGGALPYRKALGMGARRVAGTEAASFKLVKRGFVSDIGRGFGGWGRLAKQFRKPTRKGRPLKDSDIFIEKRKYRIDMPGEFRGITLKGIRASKRKKWKWSI